MLRIVVKLEHIFSTQKKNAELKFTNLPKLSFYYKNISSYDLERVPNINDRKGKPPKN